MPPTTLMTTRPSLLRNSGKLIVFVALLTQLIGCGYQLRGSETGAADQVVAVSDLGPIYIESAANTPFYNRLRSKLEAASVTQTDDIALSKYRLKVFKIKTQQHPISYDKNGDVAEYRKQTSLSFELTDATGAPAINATRLRVEEIFQSNKNNISADRSKEAALQQELAQKLVDQIFWALKTASLQEKAAQPAPVAPK